MNHARKYIEDTFEFIELKNDSVTARIVVNIGNTLYSLMKDEEEKMYFPFSFEEYKSNAKLAGNPFLHPWANRLEGEYLQVEDQRHLFPGQYKNLLYRDGNNLPMHGLLLKSDQWKTVELHEEENSYYHVAEFIFEDESLLSIFPFKHTIQIKHLLQGSELAIETTVFNQDEKSMPISFGYHPYFLIDATKRENYSITIPAPYVIDVDEKMIPLDRVSLKEYKWNFSGDSISLKDISFDNGFQGLKLNENGITTFALNDLHVLFDAHYPFAQIYAPDNINKPYVCIEPMTAATNALNQNGCIKIRPGEKYTAGFSLLL